MNILLGTLLVLISSFLIMIVLVQRGRGGGLTGALGGAGGQSAFGAKAGDVFTRITMVTAGIWIVLCVITVKMVGGGSDPLDLGGANVPAAGEVESSFKPSEKTDADGTSKTNAGTSTEKPALKNLPQHQQTRQLHLPPRPPTQQRRKKQTNKLHPTEASCGSRRYLQSVRDPTARG
jgi:preprotein translocase subunit SecG